MRPQCIRALDKRKNLMLIYIVISESGIKF